MLEDLGHRSETTLAHLFGSYDFWQWAYDRKSSIGRLDKGLDEAQMKGWTVVDMKQDWKVVYPFEKK
jgi:hypothetical protein